MVHNPFQVVFLYLIIYLNIGMYILFKDIKIIRIRFVS